MERYPERHFVRSSAQEFKWLEQLYPPLFERRMSYPIDGSWVENNANMLSGEALARQPMFGQHHIESRFGLRSRIARLPDSFGLTGTAVDHP